MRVAFPGGKGRIGGERLDQALLFVLLLLCYAYTFPRWADWNENSHFDSIVAIVDHGTLSIDCCVQNTGDYALFEGHAYTDKAPGLTLLGLPIYFAFSRLAVLPAVSSALTRLAGNGALAATLRAGGSGLLADKLHFALGLTFTTFFLVAVPAALLGAILYRFLGRYTARRSYRAAVTLSYALLTVAFPYANSFYSHQLVAMLLFAAFVLATGRGAQGSGRGRYWLIGFLLGTAIIAEYPAVLIAGPLFLYTAYRLADRRQIGWTLLGGAIPGALGAAYNFAIFHTPLPVGYHYSALWQSQHSTGFMSLTYPKLPALWGVVASPYRGLFFLSPVLLLAIVGLVHLWRQPRYRAEAALTSIAIAAFFAFNASSSMWWGGFAIGPRYLVPMLPFLAWPLVFFLERYGRKIWAQVLFAALGLLSLIGVWGLSLAGQAFPPETLSNPWPQYAWPHLLAGDLARNAGMLAGLHGWWSLIPLFLIGACAMGLLWRGGSGRLASLPSAESPSAAPAVGGVLANSDGLRPMMPASNHAMPGRESS